MSYWLCHQITHPTTLCTKSIYNFLGGLGYRDCQKPRQFINHISSAVVITWRKTQQKDIILSTSGESQNRRSKKHALIIWMCNDKQHTTHVNLQRNTTFWLSPQHIVDKQARAADKCKANHNPFYDIHQLHHTYSTMHKAGYMFGWKPKQLALSLQSYYIEVAWCAHWLNPLLVHPHWIYHQKGNHKAIFPKTT